MTSSMEDRLRSLESANRLLMRNARIARVFAVALLATVAVGMTCREEPDPNHIKAITLEVERITVRDGQGAARIVLIGGSDVRGGNATIVGVFDAKGRRRAALTTTVGNEGDAVALEFKDEDGKTGLELALENLGPDGNRASIAVGRPDSERAGLFLNEKGPRVVVLGRESADGVAGMYLSEAGPRVVVSGKGSADGAAGMYMDELGPRVVVSGKENAVGTAELHVNANGPRVTVSDARGRARAILGTVEAPDSTGKPVHYPESTMTLVGENGKVLYRMPPQ